MGTRKHKPLEPAPGLVLEEQERVWNGRFPLDVVRFRHTRFDGRVSGLRTWEVWRRGRAAAVLPYDPIADAVVLIEQYRLPALVAGLDPVMIELPAGLCDDGEPAEETARRETEEEMGLTATRLIHIGGFLLSPGGMDELCEIFLGRVQALPADTEGIIGHAGLAAEDEDIRVRVWPASVAIEAVLEGRMPNSVTVIGLLWLAARREAVRAAWRDA